MQAPFSNTLQPVLYEVSWHTFGGRVRTPGSTWEEIWGKNSGYYQAVSLPPHPWHWQKQTCVCQSLLIIRDASFISTVSPPCIPDTTSYTECTEWSVLLLMCSFLFLISEDALRAVWTTPLPITVLVTMLSHIHLLVEARNLFIQEPILILHSSSSFSKCAFRTPNLALKNFSSLPISVSVYIYILKQSYYSIVQANSNSSFNTLLTVILLPQNTWLR